MKTPIIIALSIVGVLGTAGVAMAANAGTLASFNQTHIGDAPTVLTPTVTHEATAAPQADTSSATPEPTETAEPVAPVAPVVTAPKSGDDASEHRSAPSTYPTTSPTHSYSDDNHSSDHTAGGSGSDD
ncbi:MAG: hypothetical protein HIU88_12565 [Acidobacteria bacterium]|nr:hypothetical protein [Acidobacteriota bacterium]